MNSLILSLVIDNVISGRLCRAQQQEPLHFFSSRISLIYHLLTVSGKEISLIPVRPLRRITQQS